MGQEMRTVDIVIPCYNYGRYLARCVESVVQQAGVRVRALIIDDASTDDTSIVCKELSNRYQAVTVRRHERNQGHIATYNEGLLEWASADYCLLLSADDLLAPNALRRAADVMERYTDVALVYGRAQVISDDETLPSPPERATDNFVVLSQFDFLRRCVTRGNPVPTPTAVVRTEVQHQIGGYRADLPHSGDMEMWMRIASHSRVGVLEAVQGYYRWHTGNMSAKYYDKALRDQEERVRACAEALDRAKEKVLGVDGLRELMRRSVAEEAFWLGTRAFEDGDVVTSDACFAFALSNWKALKHTAFWWRLRVKRIVGPEIVRRVRRVAKAIRRRDAATATGGPKRFHVGQMTGWWPG
jgi:hypothetical protein